MTAVPRSYRAALLHPAAMWRPGGENERSCYDETYPKNPPVLFMRPSADVLCFFGARRGNAFRRGRMRHTGGGRKAVRAEGRRRFFFSGVKEEPVKAADLPDGVSVWEALPAADGERLYLLSSADGRLFRLENGAWQMEAEIDLSFRGGEEGGEMARLRPISPVVRRGILYFVVNEDNNVNRKLYAAPLSTGECAEVRTEGLAVESVAPGKDALEVFDREQRRFASLQTETGGFEWLTEAAEGDFPVYDPGSRDVYALRENAVMRSRGGDAEKRDALPYESAATAEAACVWNGRYTVLSGGRVYVCGEKAAASMSGFTVCYDEGRLFMRNELTAFSIAHPDAGLTVINESSDRLAERLAAAGFAGDETVDIFAVDDWTCAAGTLAERGYALPIVSEKLNEKTAAMYPAVREAVTRDGALYGFPAEVALIYRSARQDLIEEAGLRGVPKTYAEYFGAALDWYEAHPGVEAYTFERDNADVVAVHMIRDFARARAKEGERLSFDDENLKAALEGLKSVAPYLSGGEGVPAVFKMSGEDVLRRVRDDDWRQIRGLPALSFESGEEEAVGGALTYFVINPASPRKEEALRFLEFYADNMELEKQYMLYPGFNEPVLSDEAAYALKELDEEIAVRERDVAQDVELLGKIPSEEVKIKKKDEIEAQKNLLAAKRAERRYLETAGVVFEREMIEKYREVAKYMSFQNNELLGAMFDRADMMDPVSKYLEGRVTLEQAVAEMDRRAEMMHFEDMR